MQAIIITIGDELLIGQTIDTNSAEIATALGLLNIEVINRWAIADKEEEICFFLDLALQKADLIIFTGGLGPTADDITKPTLCEFFKGHLKRNEAVYEHLERIFSIKNQEVSARNAAQADVPDCCEVLFNKMGTAPGMLFRQGEKMIASLPGVPFEMRHILYEQLMPILEKESLTKSTIQHFYLLISGIGESDLADKIIDIETSMPESLHLAYLPTHKLIKLRLTVTSDNAQEAKNLGNEWIQKLRNRLGELVVGQDDIQWPEIIHNLFIKRNLTLSTAESCTGGYFGHLITNLPGSSLYYKGGLITYANDLKKHCLEVSEQTLKDYGAVSEQTVIEMAQGAVKAIESDYAISFSGILGPGGGNEKKPVGLIWIAVADKNSYVTEKLQLRYDRLSNKSAAAAAGFALLYRFVNERKGNT